GDDVRLDDEARLDVGAVEADAVTPGAVDPDAVEDGLGDVPAPDLRPGAEVDAVVGEVLHHHVVHSATAIGDVHAVPEVARGGPGRLHRPQVQVLEEPVGGPLSAAVGLDVDAGDVDGEHEPVG